MINEGDFRENVEKIINSSENYTKEELYIAFLEMTERYLNEMITTHSLENTIFEELGEEDAVELLENIGEANPAMADLDAMNAVEPNKKQVLQNLFDFIEGEFGIDII